MNAVRVERLDHLGLVAGLLKELGIVELIDTRLRPDGQEEITCGEAVAGMILNGLGFSQRPLSLTPRFFADKPLDLLFRRGVKAAHFNRFKLGRTLDQIFAYGCDALFGEVAASVCAQEAVDRRFLHLDTTTFSVTGAYESEEEKATIELSYGYSKDHRPDLKQAVLELMTSQDGGIPLISHSWDGHAADSPLFQARAAQLLQHFKAADPLPYLVADSKLYTRANAVNLQRLPFITRIPRTLQLTQQGIDQALAQPAAWQPLDETVRFQRIFLCHYGIAQQWIIVYSQAAYHRARHSLDQQRQREAHRIDRQLRTLRRKRFADKKTAYQALRQQADTWRYHRLRFSSYASHRHYTRPGPRTPDTPYQIYWKIDQVELEVEEALFERQAHQQACFVLGNRLPDPDQKKAPPLLTPQQVIQAYKAQSQVESGFRFLKDPLFFASALFVKKPQRLQALLMVMTLALLVYSVAQRRLRQQLARQHQSLPNQIGQPTATPTLRWVFQLLEGIHRVSLILQGSYQTLIEGMTDLKRKILQLCGATVCQIYQIAPS